MESARNILLLDSNEQSALEIQRFLKAGAYPFVVNHTAILKDGIASLRNSQPDLILIDAHMTGAVGFETLRHLIQSSHIPVILLSDSRNAEVQRQAELLHAGDYMVKNKINLFHLQKVILNTLKINAAEIKLDATYSEFSNRQATMLKMLDKTSAAVIVVGLHNEVFYASARAYQILNDEALQQRMAGYITYRQLAQEEELTVKHDNNLHLHIAISSIDWNGANANLFVIEKKPGGVDKDKAIFKVEAIQPVLDALHTNILILEGPKILFANTAATKHLNAGAQQLGNAHLSDFFQQESKSNEGIALIDLFREKESRAWLKQADGSLLPATLVSKPLSIGESLLEICWFVVQPEGNARHIPGNSSDGETFSNDSILHLASHDLREPVRTILNYIQLISDSLKKNNYESAAEYSEHAKSAADRMEKLLSDFKVFISLNEHKLNPVKVSVKQVAAEVVKQLKPLIESTKAEINIADIPEISADGELLDLLLYNLVDNALKFHKKGKKPVIDIGCDKFEGKMLFCVRDNGMGVAKKYHEKIFEMFERLNRVDEYPGNGLGLAICQRIVEMHGGKIWVESLPGLGSSFYFTLNTK